MRVEDGKGWCPDCEEVVDLATEDNSHGCTTVYDYVDICAECGERTEEEEPEPMSVSEAKYWHRVDERENEREER